MATTTFYPETSTNTYYTETLAQATWAGARDAGNAALGTTDNHVQIRGIFYTGNSKYYVIRGFFWFDTSALPVELINSAIFKATTHSGADADTTGYLVESTQDGSAALLAADFGAVGGTSFGSATFSETLDTENSLTLNDDGITNISKTGISYFALMDTDDFNNVTPTSGNSEIQVYSVEEAGATKDPKLAVTYGEAPPATGTIVTPTLLTLGIG